MRNSFGLWLFDLSLFCSSSCSTFELIFVCNVERVEEPVGNTVLFFALLFLQCPLFLSALGRGHHRYRSLVQNANALLLPFDLCLEKFISTSDELWHFNLDKRPVDVERFTIATEPIRNIVLWKVVFRDYLLHISVLKNFEFF